MIIFPDHCIGHYLIHINNYKLKQVSMRQKFTSLVLISTFLLITHCSFGFSVFSVGGVQLICPSCDCASMQAAGVNYENCIDVLTGATQGNTASNFKKLIRYSPTSVMMHTANGTESPIASDDVQKQFDELIRQPGWEKRLSSLKITSGDISDARLNYIATQLKLPIENKLKIKGGDEKKKSNFIFQLSANEGATATDGVSKELRIIPNGSLQYVYKNFGLGLDAGTFKSRPDFSFSNYAKQFEGLGGLDFDKSIDYWKSTYFSVGPQYSFNFKVPGSRSTGAASLFALPSPSNKLVTITLSLKGGLTRNNSPEISFKDSLVPGTAPRNIIVASYKAPDSINTNGYNIKPGIAITYWFNKYFGATVNAQYMIAGGQDEFKTGYRDLKDVNFNLQPKEVWYQISRAPFITTTTKGPGNMLSIGAGVSVKLGVGKSKPELPVEVETKRDNRKPVLGESNVTPAEVNANNPGQKPEEQISENPEKKTKKESDKEYIHPFVVSPPNGTSFSEDEARKPLVFKWTPVTPTPLGEVVYYVKVVEVQQGQQVQSAIASNRAVFEKELSMLSSTTWNAPQPVRGEIKQYAWNVRATDRAGKPYGDNNGTSEPAAFSIGQNDIDIAIDTLRVECCKNGKQQIKITIKNNLANNNTTLKKVWIMAVNGNFGVPYPQDISAQLVPALPFNFLPSSLSGSQGRMDFFADIDCIKDIKSLVVKAEGERNTMMGIVTDNDLESDTLRCICDECDKIKIDIPDKANIKYTAASLNLNSGVLVSPKKVTKITANIVYFSYIPESDECAPCNKDSKTFGNFISASLSANGFPSTGAITYGHEAVWNSNNQLGSMLNGQFDFNISTPPLVKCCSARFKFCIRYSFLFDDCTVCEKVVCYTYNKEGCIN